MEQCSYGSYDSLQRYYSLQKYHSFMQQGPDLAVNVCPRECIIGLTFKSVHWWLLWPLFPRNSTGLTPLLLRLGSRLNIGQEEGGGGGGGRQRKDVLKSPRIYSRIPLLGIKYYTVYAPRIKFQVYVGHTYFTARYPYQTTKHG